MGGISEKPSTAGVSRRTLIVGSLAAVGTITVASRFRLRPRAFGAHILSLEEMRIIDAMAEVLFPRGDFPIDGIEAGVAAEVDRIVAKVLPPVQRAAFRYVLRALEWGTFASRGRRFSALSAEDRLEVLTVWATPRVLARRVSSDSFKAVLGMAYFSHPEVLGSMGWRVGCGVQTP